MKDPLKPEKMTLAETTVDEDRKRQFNTLVGLSGAFACYHTSGKSSVVPICFAPLKDKHFR